MARVTIEDSLKNAKSRFGLVLLTAQRARQLLKGSKPLIEIKNNREIVAALREIAAGKVLYAHPEFLKGYKDNFRLVADDTEFTGDEEDYTE
jgi:DNA-directed RNA polymerase subunit omega